jgi:hypothetical protein
MSDVQLLNWQRVLTIATEMTGNERRAEWLMRNEPLRTFGGKTIETLIQEGRTDDVIAYLNSLEGGAAG